MYELLNQSYGIPEYSDEEKLKRLLSTVLKAIDDSRETKYKYANFKIKDFDNFWEVPNDPHNISVSDPDPNSIKIRKLPEKPIRFDSPYNVLDNFLQNNNMEKTEEKKDKKSE